MSIMRKHFIVMIHNRTLQNYNTVENWFNESIDGINISKEDEIYLRKYMKNCIERRKKHLTKR